MIRQRFHEQLDSALARANAALTLARQIHAALESLTHSPAPHSLWRNTSFPRFNDFTI